MHAIIHVLSDVFPLTVFLPLVVIPVCSTWHDWLSQNPDIPRNAPNWEAVANPPKYVWPAERMNTERERDCSVGKECVAAGRGTLIPLGGQGQCVLHSHQLHCLKGLGERKKHLLKAGWLNCIDLSSPIRGWPQDDEFRWRESRYQGKRAVPSVKHWPHQMQQESENHWGYKRPLRSWSQNINPAVPAVKFRQNWLRNTQHNPINLISPNPIKWWINLNSP